MTFANMTPAERTKASGLIGLIVVMAFFVIHTMMGALAPKVPNAAALPEVADTAGQPPAPVTVVSQSTPVPGAAPSPEQAFPVHPDSGPGDLKKTAATDAAADTSDPFIPLRPTDSKGAAPAATKADVEIRPTPEPVFASKSGLPNPFGGAQPAGMTGGLQPALPNPEPEIKVIGVVEGDQSVATIEVGGKARNVRPGESLAKGYRLDSVYGDGVRVRHDRKTYAIRVGNAINEETKSTKLTQQ